MRWCTGCKKFNSGKPLRCGYCGASLSGRLCERNHINPSDPKLAFCGDCGKPLEKSGGTGGSSMISSLMGQPKLLLIALAVGAVVGLWWLVSRAWMQYQIGSSVVVLVIVFGLLRLVLKILPVSIRNFLCVVLKAVVELLLGTGNKG
jgi:hypothetical protein